MSLLAWTGELPDNWETKPLRSAADYVVSNVDKVTDDDEIPIRLCNYTDVYNNEFITLALDFMQATASEAEISKFRVAVDDVIITKDSESWDDIGVPALVRETAGDLVCGYHLALLRPLKQKMDGAFLFRCLQAKPVRVQLELATNGVTRFGIPKSEIGTMRLPVRRSRNNAPSPTISTARRNGWMRWWQRRSGGSGCWPKSAGRTSPVPLHAASTQTPHSETPASRGSARFRRAGRLNARDGCSGSAMNAPTRERRSSSRCRTSLA